MDHGDYTSQGAPKRARTDGPGGPGLDTAFLKQQQGYNFSQVKMNDAMAADRGSAKPPASKVAIRRAGGKTWRDDTLEQRGDGVGTRATRSRSFVSNSGTG